MCLVSCICQFCQNFKFTCIPLSHLLFMQNFIMDLFVFGICVYTSSLDKTYIYLEAYFSFDDFYIFEKEFHLSLNASFHDFIDYMTFYTLCLMFTHDLFPWDYMSFIANECWWLCDFQCCTDLFLFDSLLEGLHTSFQDYHKTSCVFLHFWKSFQLY